MKARGHARAEKLRRILKEELRACKRCRSCACSSKKFRRPRFSFRCAQFVCALSLSPATQQPACPYSHAHALCGARRCGAAGVDRLGVLVRSRKTLRSKTPTPQTFAPFLTGPPLLSPPPPRAPPCLLSTRSYGRPPQCAWARGARAHGAALLVCGIIATPAPSRRTRALPPLRPRRLR